MTAKYHVRTTAICVHLLLKTESFRHGAISRAGMSRPHPGFRLLAASAAVLLACFTAAAWDANRLTYLDEDDPFHVGLDFPALITPQWVGEEGVTAVVTRPLEPWRLCILIASLVGPT